MPLSLDSANCETDACFLTDMLLKEDSDLTEQKVLKHRTITWNNWRSSLPNYLNKVVYACIRSYGTNGTNILFLT